MSSTVMARNLVEWRVLAHRNMIGLVGMTVPLYGLLGPYGMTRSWQRFASALAPGAS
jgi:hypothetical protein